MPERSKVFWLDEEENAAYPEILQIKFHQIEVEYIKDVDRALDFLSGSPFCASSFSAFIIDAHMPTYGDPRLERDKETIHKSLAGVRLCSVLAADYGPRWAELRERVLLYTNLPASERVDKVRSFAHEQGIQFQHKTADGAIFQKLKSLGWI